LSYTCYYSKDFKKKTAGNIKLEKLIENVAMKSISNEIFGIYIAPKTIKIYRIVVPV